MSIMCCNHPVRNCCSNGINAVLTLYIIGLINKLADANKPKLMEENSYDKLMTVRHVLMVYAASSLFALVCLVAAIRTKNEAYVLPWLLINSILLLVDTYGAFKCLYEICFADNEKFQLILFLQDDPSLKRCSLFKLLVYFYEVHSFENVSIFKYLGSHGRSHGFNEPV